MAIDSEHAEYTKRKEQWEKLRDCVAGQEAIHEKGVKYLAKLSGQSDAEYKAYKERAAFYNATGRTVDGLSGMVFRKEPIVNVPDGLKPYLDDVTLNGLSLMGFAESIVDDAITVGRAGILVDYPATPVGVTRAQAEAANIRPFLKHYTAENIFNWKVEGRNNSQVLTQVRLWEIVENPGDGEFDAKEEKQIRVLDLDDAGRYRQRVFIKVATPTGEKWIQKDDDIIPLKNGAPIKEIPFYFIGVKNGLPCPEKPPLIDLANVNISHYKSTADLEHGAHFTGLPTAVITGHIDATEDGQDAQEYRIGAATAWVFPSPETKVQYLEFNGQGLEALEKRIAKKEEQMAFLGARMLTPEKKGIESSETAQIHRMGEISVLASLVGSVSETIEKAVSFMSDWAGFGGEIEFDLNKDFIAVPMNDRELLALLQTWQAGGIAFEDFLDNLKRGEIVREERTADDIRSEVETENPFDGEDMPVEGGGV